jgi:hypothetical protein
MAGQRSSFGKLQRDRDKKAKAAAKRSRRQDGADDSALVEDGAPAPATANGHQVSTADLLERIAEIHQQFDAGTISYELFEETKADLMSRLPVD